MHSPASPNHQPRRSDPDCDFIINRAAHSLTNSASDTMFGRHAQPKACEVHDEGIHRALGHACVTSLPCRAISMGHNGEAHVDLFLAWDRKQRIGLAGRDAREIVAELARCRARKDDRGSVQGMEFYAFVGTGLHTIGATRAPV